MYVYTMVDRYSIYLYTCTYMHAYTDAHTCMPTYVRTCVYIHMYIHLHTPNSQVIPLYFAGEVRWKCGEVRGKYRGSAGEVRWKYWGSAGEVRGKY